MLMSRTWVGCRDGRATKERRRGEIEERKKWVLKEREERGEGEGEEILKGVWMEGWECVAAQ